RCDVLIFHGLRSRYVFTQILRKIRQEVTRKSSREVEFQPRRATLRLPIWESARQQAWNPALQQCAREQQVFRCGTAHTRFLGQRFRGDLRREGSDDLFKARISAQRIPVWMQT